MSPRVADLLGASLLVAIGVAMGVGALGYGLFGEGGRVGPGLMPFGAGALLAIFGATIAFETLRRKGDREHREPGQAERDPKRSRHAVALTFAFLLCALVLTDVIGFLPAFGVLVGVLIVFVERQSAARAVAISVAAVAASWAMFVLFLQVPLPDGIF
ncbi:MAG: tripartite tricarboxylate transporter TctB family protein [Actinomycetota bacterium]